MLKKISKSPLNQIKDDFIQLFDEISIFFKQLALTKEEIDYGITLTSAMREKFLYITDIYSISPDGFPGLPGILANNCNRLKQTTDYVKSQDNTENLHAFYQYIVDYDAVLLEQYLKISIEGLYQGIITKNLPLLPAIEAQEKLSFSIESLKDFFKRIIKNHERLSAILFELENIGSNLPPEISTYFIILTKLLTSINNIDLDFSGQENVVNTMILQIRVAKNTFKLSTVKRLAECSDEMPVLKKQKNGSSDQIIIYENELLNAKSVFLKLFTLCRDKMPNVSDKIDQIDNCLNKMYAIYDKAPNDFTGLPAIFLKDANLLYDRCQHFISNKKDLMPELEKFNQQMIRRHVQLQINYLYNHIFCDSDSISIDNSENWQISFQSIETTLNLMYDKMETVDTKSNANDLINKFKILKAILLIEENLSPAIKFARHCIIALDKVFKNSAELFNLPVKIIEKIMETINEMRSHLVDQLENDLTHSDLAFIKKRMQVLEAITPNKDQDLPTKKSLANENSIAYNLFTAKYSTPTFTTPFSFFSERKSASELRKIAKSKGLTCVDVEGDGNCLFSAVALLLKNKRAQYAGWQLSTLANKLRDDANCYLKNNQKDYEKFVADENYDQFIARMKKTNQWAGHLHIDVLSKILNINIVVINSDNSRPIVLQSRNANDVICLGYEVDLHFQALMPSDKSNNLPPAIIEMIQSAENGNITPSFNSLNKK